MPLQRRPGLGSPSQQTVQEAASRVAELKSSVSLAEGEVKAARSAVDEAEKVLTAKQARLLSLLRWAHKYHGEDMVAIGTANYKALLRLQRLQPGSPD